MTWTIFLALALIGVAGLYIFLRRRRSPKADQAMIAVSIASFISGTVLGAWVYRAVEITSAVNTGAPPGAGSTPAVTSSSALAPLITPGAWASPFAQPIG